MRGKTRWLSCTSRQSAAELAPIAPIARSGRPASGPCSASALSALGPVLDRFARAGQPLGTGADRHRQARARGSQRVTNSGLSSPRNVGPVDI
jgi:hypothetical protein